MQYRDTQNSPGYQLWLASNAWMRIVRKALVPYDLTHVQFILLVSVDILTNENGKATQADVSRFAALDENMTSQVTKALVKKGLIERIPCPADARAYRIALTEAGATRTVEARQAVRPAIEGFFAPLGDKVADLTQLLKCVIQPED